MDKDEYIRMLEDRFSLSNAVIVYISEILDDDGLHELMKPSLFRTKIKEYCRSLSYLTKNTKP